jgi:alpha-glutamyl/putrescinyl thymine pyrophosphorylase clade 1
VSHLTSSVGAGTQLEIGLPQQGGGAGSRRGRADPVPKPIHVAGRLLHPTPVFITYWRFAAKRHAIYIARVAGQPGPWTDDPVLLRHRFTNCYRAADRVSQHLIRRVCYTGSQQAEEIVFRTLLFRMFNRVSTWELLSGCRISRCVS